MRKFLFAAAAVFLLCSAFTGAKERRQYVHAGHNDSLRSNIELYTYALQRFLIYGDTLHSYSALNKIVEKDSTYTPALNLLSKLERDNTKALYFARKAHEGEKDNKFYLEDFGQALIRAGKYSEAVECYEKIVKTTHEPDYYRILAILYRGNNQPYAALSALDSAEMKYGRIPQLSRLKENLYMSTKQYLKAEETAKQSIEDAPYLAENYLALANVYASTARDSLAQIEYLRAIKTDTTWVNSWIELAEFYHSRKRYPAYLNAMSHIFDSKEIPVQSKVSQFRTWSSNMSFYREFYPHLNTLLNKLVIHYPQNNDVLNLYANHMIASGNAEGAATVMKQALKHSPTKQNYSFVIELESYLQHPDSASYYIDAAIAQFPDDTEMKLLKGHNFSINRKFDEAIRSYESVLKQTKDTQTKGMIYGFIGDAWHQKGDMPKTYSAYNKALKCNPKNASVLNNYAYFLSLDSKNLDKALSMATQAISIDSGNSTYLDTIAWVLYKMGRYEEAKKYMKQAMSLDKNSSAELALHYGDILDALGEEFLAKSYWKKAIERGYKDTDAIEKRIEFQIKRKNKN